MRTALITGINGQDGSYLAELLLNKGYHVVGTVREYPNSASDLIHAGRTSKSIQIVEADLREQAVLEDLLRTYQPEELYNLAARASSSELWTDPMSTGELNGLAVLRLLDAVDRVAPRTKFIQASSSEVFGNATEAPQSETTRFHPRNPYGAAKAFAHWMTTVYREQRGLFACSCILYNHESPRRGLEFVTRKISHGAAKIKLGLAKELRLGDLEARRDWGFAGDFVQALWMSLQQSTPGDYIVATGETHSVREFCDVAFSHLGLRYQDYVVQDRESVRSPESVLLVGDATKAKRVLGWIPTVDFETLVTMMVDADLRLLHNSRRAETPSERVIH